MKIKKYYHLYPSTLNLHMTCCFDSGKPEYAREQIDRMACKLAEKYRVVIMPLFICDIVPMVFLKNGFIVKYIETDNPYHISVGLIEKYITNNGCVVFIPNYFGMEQAISEISELCKSKGCFFFLDNSQQLDIAQFTEKSINFAALYSHRKFYLGGRSLLLSNLDNAGCLGGFSVKQGIKENVKAFIGQHTNSKKVREKLMRGYQECKDLFLPYTDLGYRLPDDIVPLGIPLKMNNRKSFDEISIKKTCCYIWPKYAANTQDYVDRKKILVYPIHELSSVKKVKSDLHKLKQKGVID